MEQIVKADQKVLLSPKRHCVAITCATRISTKSSECYKYSYTGTNTADVSKSRRLFGADTIHCCLISGLFTSMLLKFNCYEANLDEIAVMKFIMKFNMRTMKLNDTQYLHMY